MLNHAFQFVSERIFNYAYHFHNLNLFIFATQKTNVSIFIHGSLFRIEWLGDSFFTINFFKRVRKFFGITRKAGKRDLRTKYKKYEWNSKKLLEITDKSLNFFLKWWNQSQTYGTKMCFYKGINSIIFSFTSPERSSHILCKHLNVLKNVQFPYRTHMLLSIHSNAMRNSNVGDTDRVGECSKCR